MSVAFRRDSDEEHLEPKFERPIPPGPNLVTPRGLALLTAEVDAAVARLEQADAADRDALARDLRYWRIRLSSAQLAPKRADGEAGIGSRVRFILNGAEQTIEIVGVDEADPDARKLGFTAPLARAVMGAGAGDVMPFAGRDEAIEIIAVDP